MLSPFDLGKTLIFKSMGHGGPLYLSSSPATGEVNLAYSTDYTSNMGTHYEANKLSDGTYSLKTLCTSGSKRYVDSLSAAPSHAQMVFLSEDIDGKIGTHWRPEKQGDGTYALVSMSKATSDDHDRYLDSWPASHTPVNVYLSVSADPGVNIGTHWKVGVDSYTGAEIQNILNTTYPNSRLSLTRADALFHPMDYATLKKIWDGSGLSGLKWKSEMFDCDDFAICFKAAVAKWYYNETEPAQKPMASLCGIIWASRPRVAHAYNFTVDPFGQLILFEPQNGATIPTYDWNPYFCMA